MCARSPMTSASRWARVLTWPASGVHASGEFDLSRAVTFARAVGSPGSALEGLVPMGALLGDMPACRLSAEGLRRVHNGRDVEPAFLVDPPLQSGSGLVRLLDDIRRAGGSGSRGGQPWPFAPGCGSEVEFSVF